MKIEDIKNPEFLKNLSYKELESVKDATLVDIIEQNTKDKVEAIQIS